MRIAVVGCSHGQLDKIYQSIHRIDKEAKQRGELPVELLLCCGDFQANRCTADLYTMKAPAKFRLMHDFHNYYAGRKKAPILTLVVGGNHEASSHLWECYHGGWLAPNIYFLGKAGSVLVDGWLRVAGTSGIWKACDWKKGHFERVPYIPSTLTSAYHVRQYDITRLMHLQNNGPKVDIFMSHDWPNGVEKHGDTEALLRENPRFKTSVLSNTLGSPPLEALLKTLKPARWCSGHMHIRFTADVPHGKRQHKHKRNATTAEGLGDAEYTKFLALSKPGEDRPFLEVIDVPTPTHARAHVSPVNDGPRLFFDPHWLAVVRAFAPYLPLQQQATPLPPATEIPQLIADAAEWVRANIVGRQEDGGLRAIDDVQVFQHTAPPTRSANAVEDTTVSPRAYFNPQTQAFCDMLGIPNVIGEEVTGAAAARSTAS
ncbi:lariat debranching enzyme, C-terminal domain-containing protein [Mycena amicta]|nr:lariat debranching enzyme, C-terminal domain-containing protein [Mycena amicta]